MSVLGGVTYSNPINFGQNDPYVEGKSPDILADRKGGWLVRHRFMGWETGKKGRWIEAVPNRALADQINKALCEVEQKVGHIHTLAAANQLAKTNKAKK